MIIYESSTLEKISAYIAKNRLKTALEAEVKYMVVEAKETGVHLEGSEVDFESEQSDKQHVKGTPSMMTSIWVLIRTP